MKKIVLKLFIFILFLGVALWVSPQKVEAYSCARCSTTNIGYWVTFTDTNSNCLCNPGTCSGQVYTCNASCGTCTPVYGNCSTSCGTGNKPYDSYNDCGAACGAGSVPCTVCSPLTCAGYTYGDYGSCSSTCGEAGTKCRPRYYACNGGAAGTDCTSCTECDTCGCSGYTTGSWGTCSQSCGPGSQTRTVTDNCSGSNACAGCGQTCSQSCNNGACTAPSLDLPANGATNQSVNPVLKTTATDAESDYLRYKIQICTDSAMTQNCQTFTQPTGTPQTGWTGQNAQSSTAYTSGTQAVYTIQSALNFGTTYYWRSYRIDPGGSNSWSNTQASPYSFTTLVSTVPNTPTLDLPADGATNQSLTPVLKTTTTDPSGTDYLRYKIQICTDLAMTLNCVTRDQTSSQTGWSGQNAETSTAYTSGTQAVYTVQAVNALSGSTTYYWRSYAIDPGNSNTWSATQTPYSFTTRPPDCSSIPRSGNFTVTGTLCAFPGDVNGVDAGTGTTNTASLIIGQTGTAGSLSVLCNQTIAAGSLVFTNGSITIIKNPDGSSCGATIKPHTPLYVIDADSDGYPALTYTTQYFTAGTNRARRSASIDYNDASNTVYPGTTCNGACSINNTDGTCAAVAAGENGLAACQRCNGTSLAAVNVTDNTQDTEGSNVCSATCKKCSSGSCVNQTASEDLFSNQCPGFDCDGGVTKYYHGWSSKTCYYKADVTDATAVCDGAGACKTMAVMCGASGQGVSSGFIRDNCKIETGYCTGTTAGSGSGNITIGTDPNNDCASYGCTSYIGGWSTYMCKKAIASSNDGMCNGAGACYTTFADECTIGTTTSYACGTSTGCEYACVVGALATSYDQVAEVCYTSLQHGCSTGYACNSTGACVATTVCRVLCGYCTCTSTCQDYSQTCVSGYSNSSCTTEPNACAGSSNYCLCQ